MEEEADRLLDEYAKSKGVSLRKLGVLNARTQRLIRRRETSLNAIQSRRHN